MLEKKLKNKLTDEKGSGLVLALMVLLVLSVLSASLGVVTIGSLQLSTVNRDTNSAYYIAEAGANRAYEEFKQLVEETSGQPVGEDKTNYFNAFNSINKKEYNDFGPQFGDRPTAKVSINPPDVPSGEKRDYTIRSTGVVGDKQRIVEKKVEVTWIPPSKSDSGIIFIFPNIPEDVALITSHKIETTGGNANVEGKIYLIDEKQGYKLDGKIRKKEILSKDDLDSRFSLDKDWKFNNDWEINNNWQVKEDWKEYDKYSKPLAEGKFQELSLSDLEQSGEALAGNYRITETKIDKGYEFNIGDDDVTLFVDEINMKTSHLTVKGNGNLTVVVKNKVTINKNSMFYGDIIAQGKVEIKTGSHIHGRIITKDKVDIEENALIKGNIVAGKEVDIGEGVMVTGNIVSKDEVEIKKNAVIKGNIVAIKEVEVKEGASVTGDIFSKDEVDIKENAVIVGNIVAGKEVDIGEGVMVTGNIVSKDEVEIKKKAIIIGNVVADGEVEIKEFTSVTGNVFSKSDVEIKENVVINGSIISKNVEISGTVIYKYQATADIVFGGGDSSEQSKDFDIDDLITSNPAIESDE